MHSLHYFPGSNTPLGFYSYFSYILPTKRTKKTVILKGGPGCGKSTLMKKVYRILDQNGIYCNLLHCSSDPESLDAICAPELGFIMLDGTAPHIIDPALPGCRDEILPLSMYWDACGIQKHRTEIEIVNSKISTAFASAYDYLRSTQSVQNHIKKVQNFSANKKTNQDFIHDLLTELDANKAHYGTAKIQKAFADAFTPNGYISYIQTYADTANEIICIDAQEASALLTTLSVYLTHTPQKLLLFYDPMYPDTDILHIYLPESKTLLTSNKSVCTGKKAKIYTVKSTSKEDTHADTDLYNILLSRALSFLKKAKSYHDELEQYYVPYMDFEAMADLPEKIVKTLL